MKADKRKSSATGIKSAKTGVTYRGSTASGADTNDRSLVVISGSTGPIGNPCRGAVVKFTTGTSGSVTPDRMLSWTTTEEASKWKRSVPTKPTKSDDAFSEM